MEKSMGKIRYYLELLLSHQAFRIVLLMMVTLRSAQLINPYIGPWVKFTLIWSAAILIKDLFTERLLLVNRWRGLLYLFLILYGITTLVNYQYNFARNIAMLFYITTNFLVIYAYDIRKDRETVRKEIQNFCHSFMYLTFAGSLVSLVVFVLNIRYRFSYMDADLERRCWLGFFGGRLWGFFTNPNAASNFAVINIMMMAVCIVMAGKALSKGHKRFYVANFIVQAIIFFLSNSRSSWICLVFFMLSLPFLALLYQIPAKVKGLNGKQLAKRAVAIALVSVFAFSGMDNFAKDILPNFVLPTNFFSKQLAQLPNSDMPDAEEDPSLDDVPEDLDRQDYGALLGGRYYLWRAGIGIVVNHPLLGVGAENVPDFARKYDMWPEVNTDPDYEPYLPGVDDGLHNIILQTAASSGIPALFVIGAVAVGFLVLLIRYFIYAWKRKKVLPEVLVMTALVLTMLVRTMSETGLIYGVYYTSIIFWTFISYITYFIEKETAGDTAFDKGCRPVLAKLSDKVFGSRKGK